MKWFGQVGFEEDSYKVAPGIYESRIIERDYYGDVLRHKKTFDNSQIVTDFNISNQLSIVSDEFLAQNLHKIVYVTFMGAKWRVSSVDIQWPRLILEIGSVYKGKEVEDGEQFHYGSYL